MIKVRTWTDFIFPRRYHEDSQLDPGLSVEIPLRNSKLIMYHFGATVNFVRWSNAVFDRIMHLQYEFCMVMHTM